MSVKNYSDPIEDLSVGREAKGKKAVYEPPQIISIEPLETLASSCLGDPIDAGKNGVPGCMTGDS